jgi:acyl-CoA reductase-like NAD-dependent aldehyde dehydrogenase
MAGLNEGVISTEIAAFGGMEESGGMPRGSKYGIEEFLEVKYLLHGRHRAVAVASFGRFYGSGVRQLEGRSRQLGCQGSPM